MRSEWFPSERARVRVAREEEQEEAKRSRLG